MRRHPRLGAPVQQAGQLRQDKHPGRRADEGDDEDEREGERVVVRRRVRGEQDDGGRAVAAADGGREGGQVRVESGEVGGAEGVVKRLREPESVNIGKAFGKGERGDKFWGFWTYSVVGQTD